jgi:dimethylamine corrinoid protein
LNFEQLKKAVVEMDAVTVRDLVNAGIKQKIDPRDILTTGLIAGMKEVGSLFSRKEYYVPEVLLASDAFYAGFDILSPLLKKQEYTPKAKVVIGVVEGDIHDIGKNIVKVMIEASGYRVIDLGKDVKTNIFVDEVQKENPDVLCLSSLMSTTMSRMADIITKLKKTALRDKTNIIVGGAPVTEEFARNIGADAYGEDAADAVRIIDELTCG